MLEITGIGILEGQNFAYCVLKCCPCLGAEREILWAKAYQKDATPFSFSVSADEERSD